MSEINLDFENVFSKINKITENTIDHEHEYFCTKLEELSAVLNKLLSGYESTEIEKDDYVTRLVNFKKICSECLGKTRGLRLFGKDNINEIMWGVWSKEFNEILKDIPGRLKLDIPVSYWFFTTEKRKIIRIWKWNNRQLLRIRGTYYRVLNTILSVLKKFPKEIPPFTRRFSPVLFLMYHVQLPASELFFNIWNDLFKSFNLSLRRMCALNVRIKNELFVHNGMEQLCDLDSRIDRTDALEKLENIAGSAEEIIQDFKNEKIKTGEYYKKSLQTIKENVLRNWEYAGTFISPARTFGKKSYQKRMDKLQKKYGRSYGEWSKHFDGEKGEIAKDLDIMLLQMHVVQTCFETFRDLKSKFEDKIKPVFMEAEETIKLSLEKFKIIDSEKKAQLKYAIIKESRTLLNESRRQKLPKMMDMVLQANLVNDYKQYISNVEKGIDVFPEFCELFKTRQEGLGKPSLKLLRISLKPLILNEPFLKLSTAHSKEITEMRKKLKRLIGSILEINQIVEYNLEAALNLLEQEWDKEKGDEAQNVVVQGLERTINQIEDAIEELDRFITDGNGFISVITLDFFKWLEELTETRKILELRIRLARINVLGRIRLYNKKILWISVKGIPIILGFIGKIFSKLYKRYLGIRKITGLAPSIDNMEEELVRFLSETQVKINQLPFVYQRLFRIEALNDDRFFEGRALEFELLRKAYDDWKTNRNSATILVGEKGSGKTTLLKLTEDKIYREDRVSRHSFEGTIFDKDILLENMKVVFPDLQFENLEELEILLTAEEKRRIIIVENLQDLFLRTVSGFEALERFMLLVMRTNKMIYWVVTCTMFSWKYLDKVLSLSKQFQHIIILEPLPASAIEKIILKRHQVSGFELCFKETPAIAQSSKFKKLKSDEERQEYMKSLYFQRLMDLTMGNVTASMLFWLLSLSEIKKDEIVLLPHIDFDYSFLYHLPAEEAFTLAAILLHDSLTADEHAKVFLQDVAKSSFILKRMCNTGILMESEHGFQIHPILYRLVINALKARNILH